MLVKVITGLTHRAISYKIGAWLLMKRTSPPC